MNKQIHEVISASLPRLFGVSGGALAIATALDVALAMPRMESGAMLLAMPTALDFLAESPLLKELT